MQRLSHISKPHLSCQALQFGNAFFSTSQNFPQAIETIGEGHKVEATQECKSTKCKAGHAGSHIWPHHGEEKTKRQHSQRLQG